MLIPGAGFKAIFFSFGQLSLARSCSLTMATIQTLGLGSEESMSGISFCRGSIRRKRRSGKLRKLKRPKKLENLKMLKNLKKREKQAVIAVRAEIQKRGENVKRSPKNQTPISAGLFCLQKTTGSRRELCRLFHADFCFSISNN